MRKKITYILITAAVSCAAFFVGKNTVNPTYDLETDTGVEAVCDYMGSIVDWNTDGEELAVMTDDGYEFYAYKSDDIYSNRLFVPIESED